MTKYKLFQCHNTAPFIRFLVLMPLIPWGWPNWSRRARWPQSPPPWNGCPLLHCSQTQQAAVVAPASVWHMVGKPANKCKNTVKTRRGGSVLSLLKPFTSSVLIISFEMNSLIFKGVAGFASFPCRNFIHGGSSLGTFPCVSSKQQYV